MLAPAKSKTNTAIIAGASIALAVLVIFLLTNAIGGGKVSDTVEDIQSVISSNGAEFKVTINEGRRTTKYKGWYTLDTKKQEAYGEISLSNSDITFAIQDGEIGIYTETNRDEDGFSEDLDKFIEPDLFFDTLNKLGNKDITSLDYEEILDGIDFKQLGLPSKLIEQFIDSEDIADALEAVLKVLDENAEECLGYEKDGDTITYDIEPYDTLNLILETLEPYIDEDIYDELKDELRSEKKYLNKMDNIDVEIVMDGKFISEVSVEIEDIMDIYIELSDVDNADKEIDEDILDEMF